MREAAGDPGAAADAAREVLARFEAKEHLVGAGWARELLGRLGGAAAG